MVDVPHQKLRRLIEALAAEGVEPRRLCADSRQVRAGDVFLAFPGLRADGRRFIVDAVHAGAAAVLWERDGHVWDASLPPVPNLPVEGLAALSGYLAHEVYGRPSELLWTVGVTGTNGKTSVTQWLARAFATLGRKCGVIGTLGIGMEADISVLSMETGRFQLSDNSGAVVTAECLLRPAFCLRAGVRHDADSVFIPDAIAA